MTVIIVMTFWCMTVIITIKRNIMTVIIIMGYVSLTTIFVMLIIAFVRYHTSCGVAIPIQLLPASVDISSHQCTSAHILSQQ